MTLYDALATQEYFANYEALLAGEPLPHGNLRGKRLDKNAFFKDNSDYEVLLRKDVPSKYWGYFTDDDMEIEVGRGPVSVSPQRRSIWSNDGVKETKTDELNLGSLKLDKKEHTPENNSKTGIKPGSLRSSSESFNLEFESDAINPKKVDFSIKSNEYKKLPEKTRPTEVDNHLEALTNQLVKENGELRAENKILASKLDAANDIIKYETNAYETIREKLKVYVTKYRKAEKMIKRMELESEKREVQENDEENAVENEFITQQVQDIDTQIAELREKRAQIVSHERINRMREAELKTLESKLTNSTVLNINISPELAKMIAQKLLGNMETEPLEKKSEADASHNVSHQTFHADVENCPFCKTLPSKDTIFNTTNMSQSQWDTLVDHLTEKVRENLGNKSADVW